MKFSPLIAELIESLACLPGVGRKSAQRMAFHLLERDRQGALRLSQSLHNAMEHVQHCQACRTFTESSLCEICADPRRKDSGLLCIVESPQDVVAVEQISEFNGRYFVLMGHLSPIDGIGPAEIGLTELDQLLSDGNFREVILATNPTVEGEATAHYIAEMCQRKGVAASRLAHGMPVGGELEYVDGNTLVHAFNGRKTI